MPVFLSLPVPTFSSECLGWRMASCSFSAISCLLTLLLSLLFPRAHKKPVENFWRGFNNLLFGVSVFLLRLEAVPEQNGHGERKHRQRENQPSSSNIPPVRKAPPLLLTPSSSTFATIIILLRRRPSCARKLSAAGQYCRGWNVPMLSPGCV